MQKYFSWLKLSGIIVFIFLFGTGTAHAFSLHIPETMERLLFNIPINTQVKGLEQEFSVPSPQEGSFHNFQVEPVMEGDQSQMLEEMGKREEEESARRTQDEARQLQDMKRGAQQMSFGLKNFESMIKQLEKDKITIPQEIKDKFSEAKALIEAAKKAETMEEFENAGAEELQEIFSDLEEFRVEFMENEMRMRDVRRMLKGVNEPLKQFERQMSQLGKKKIAIPAEMKEHLTKIKTIIAAVQNAKSWDEAEEAGIEDLQSLMENMGETQQQLEQLSRWPQTLKEVDRELKRLTGELKRTKGIVDKLSKKGTDLSGLYAEFETQVKKMKDARERADALMRGGNTEDAFNTLEEEFFSEMEDVWENHRVIMTMSNLGRFSKDFKQGITDAQRVLKDLKRKKLNTSELEIILAEAKKKGDEVLQLMKAKPLDLDVILDALQELENLRAWFEDTADKLRGNEDTRPWETGDPLFKENVQLPPDWKKVMPKKNEMETIPEETPSSLEIIPSTSTITPTL